MSRTPARHGSAAETRGLLAASGDARERRYFASDMIGSKDAADLLRCTPRIVNAWVGKGRAIGIRVGNRGLRLPRWQFESALWAALPQLPAALGTTDGWALLSFLESPLGASNSRTPREAIEQGEAQRVMDVARAEGY